MIHLNKQKIIISAVICLFLSAINTFACSCGSLPDESVNDAVKNAIKQSTAIFAGKFVGYEYHKGIRQRYPAYSNGNIDYETRVAIFQVERGWKGETISKMFLATESMKYADGTEDHSSCDISFREGETYLIYAYGKENELRANYCSRTRLLTKAEEDLKILGEGKEPVDKKDAPKSR
jgi:hypothetical protein